MPKFFVTQDKISDNQIIIDSEDVRIFQGYFVLKKVIMLRCVTDRERIMTLKQIRQNRRKILLNIISKNKRAKTEPKYKGYTFFRPLSKSVQKLEYIIQKTTELGISEIVPVKLSRCVVKIDNKRTRKRKSTVGKRLPNRRRNSRAGVLFRQCLNL